MNNDIFLSYNHDDAELVDAIAQRLGKKYGRSCIFYDAWSMQPGDGIIEKMNEGLTDFTVFFFFVSNSSLNSSMVKMEWQSALYKAARNGLKFVAVKIDDCCLPTIIAEKQYIDLYNKGLDDAIHEMECAIENKNNYEERKVIQNLVAESNSINERTLRITVKATKYAEPNPIIAFASENQFEDYSVCFNVSDSFTLQRQDVLTCNGKKLYARTAAVQRAIKPKFPFVFEVYFKNTQSLKGIQLFILIDNEKCLYSPIPIV